MLNLENVKSNNFAPLPEGKYNAFITESKMADTKAGDLSLKVTFTIADGEQKGKKIFDQYILKHSNPKVTEISHGKIKSLMENGGHPNPNKLGGPQELEGLKVGIKTKIQRSEEYGDKAVVSYFLKPTETAAPKTDDIGF